MYLPLNATFPFLFMSSIADAAVVGEESWEEHFPTTFAAASAALATAAKKQ
jgi:hypothetical protein